MRAWYKIIASPVLCTVGQVKENQRERKHASTVFFNDVGATPYMKFKEDATETVNIFMWRVNYKLKKPQNEVEMN